MITIVSCEKRMQVFNVRAPAGVEDPYGATVTMRTIAETSDGLRGVREEEKFIPGSITLLALGRVEGLPDWVASCPEVKAALDRGAVRLIQG